MEYRENSADGVIDDPPRQHEALLAARPSLNTPDDGLLRPPGFRETRNGRMRRPGQNRSLWTRSDR